MSFLSDHHCRSHGGRVEPIAVLRVLTQWATVETLSRIQSKSTRSFVHFVSESIIDHRFI